MTFSSKDNICIIWRNKSNISGFLYHIHQVTLQPFVQLNRTIIKNASDIVKDMEGGIGQNKNQN